MQPARQRAGAGTAEMEPLAPTMLRCGVSAPHPMAAPAARFDVVVAGGGVMGASIAFWLKSLAPTMRVAVVERDRTFGMASTPRSVGGIRQQFSSEANVLLSLHSARFLTEGYKEHEGAALRGKSSDHVKVEPPRFPALLQNGYLFLATPSGVPTLTQNHALQMCVGAAAQRPLPPVPIHDSPVGSTQGGGPPCVLSGACRCVCRGWCGSVQGHPVKRVCVPARRCRCPGGVVHPWACLIRRRCRRASRG
jgi:hypothetical protein